LEVEMIITEAQKNCEHDFTKTIAHGLKCRVSSIKEEFHSDAKYHCFKCHLTLKPSWFKDFLSKEEIIRQYEEAIRLMAEGIKDPICSKNCLDVCIDHNNRAFERIPENIRELL
jgi:hypothetical protein